MKTSGDRALKILLEPFKRESLFVTSAPVHSSDTITISAPWVVLLEKVYQKVKTLAKQKTREKLMT
jgi:hypothetical protein